MSHESGGSKDNQGYPATDGSPPFIEHGTEQGDGSYSYTNGAGNPLHSTGGGQAHENRPPYYALAFIMRVS
jgi:microcystin-dependent protein